MWRACVIYFDRESEAGDKNSFNFNFTWLLDALERAKCPDNPVTVCGKVKCMLKRLIRYDAIISGSHLYVIYP